MNEFKDLGYEGDTIQSLNEIANNVQPKMITSPDLPQGTRQILIVNNHNIITSGYILSGQTDSGTVIRLIGTPSPNSDQRLKIAYITFLEAGSTLPVPRFIKSKGEIRIWMYQKNLNAVLMQLHEPKVYCWIGHFPNNHIYADIHTGH